MDLIKCPICGEEYSPSYRSCPFCEEGDGPAAKRAPRRHITTRQKAQSARGGMIVVLVLVLALFGWYLFGDRLPRSDAPAEDTAAEDVQGAKPAESAAPGQTAEPSDGEAPAPAEEPGGSEDTPPAADDAPHVDASSLAMKTNVSGTLPKDPGTDWYDCSILMTDNIRLIVTGTDVTPSSWTSDNTGVVTVGSDGKLTPVSSGKANVTATVGDAKVTCIIRVH